MLGLQGRQPVEPFAHVAGLHRHKHFQAAREAQHGLDSSRTKTAASATCFSSATSTRTPPGNCNTSKVPLAAAGGSSATASNSRSRSGRPDRLPPRLCCTQLASVEYFKPVRRANWEVRRRCGPTPPECPAVVPSIPAAALSCPLSRATSAAPPQASQKNYQNHSQLS